MTDAELLELIGTLRAPEGDSTYVEAKRAGRDLPKRLWETLSAFANTSGGGVILLGLEEQAGFAVTGVDDSARIQADVASLCDQMEPPLRPPTGKALFEALRVLCPNADLLLLRLEEHGNAQLATWMELASAPRG